MTTSLSRRDFLARSAAAGSLMLAVDLPATFRPRPAMPNAAPAFAPNVFVELDADGTTTIWVSKSEMGQGVRTALPMIVADELEADWSKVQVRQADADPKYGDQGTGGSMTVSDMWKPLRKAGAQAREMLVATAAERWGVPAAECRAERGAVLHTASGRRVGYGDLATDAAKRPVPAEPRLKPQSEYKLIGTSVPNLDTPGRVTGKTMYGIDTRLPGMRFAMIARCPVIGGSMKGYDAAPARAIAGVRDVVEVPNGVAVIADTTWAAMQGRKALECHWDEGAQTRLNSDGISRMLHDRALQAGALARNDGDVPGALAGAAKTLDVSYEVPFLAHAPMEPMNCTALVTSDRCEVWAPNQWPGWARDEVATAIGMPADKVTLHVTMMGGGFGRRLLPDYVVEAAQVAKAVPGTPVQLLWSREDDMQHGWFRPASVHRLQGGLDKLGRPVALLHRVVAPSITEQRWPGTVQNGLDNDTVEGAKDVAYAIPNLRVEYGMLQTAVPSGWWRAVYTTQTVFASECFIDELAQLAGKDPVLFRRALLKAAPRHLAVLDLAAKESGWGSPLPAGRARGIALNRFWTDTIVAEVAEVSIEEGKVRVHRVTCAVDCGLTVNPDGVKAQIEGGVMFGLTAALHGAITVEGGRIQQSNFHDYKVMRMPEAPVIDIHLVSSGDGPKGVGEPGVPPIAPAVANAVSKLTGQRVRKLPIVL